MSPTPPSYEEATASMTTPYPSIFNHRVSVPLYLTNTSDNVYHVLGYYGSDGVTLEMHCKS